MRLFSWKGELKLPENCSKGAATNTGASSCCRVRSPSSKKKNLFLTTGPPTRPPYWERWKGSLSPGGVGKEAATELSRNKPKASPWIALVPERVVTLIAPEV